MDQSKHWDKIGANYGEEIFDVFASDRRKVLPDYLSIHASPQHSAVDFGCGTGKAFSMLSPGFKAVYGYDISASLLQQAEQKKYPNVVLRRADLTKPLRSFKPVEFVFSCNVVMLPDRAQNLAMLRNIRLLLKPGGTTLLVVPSLESVLLASSRMIEWYEREGVKADKIPASEFSYYQRGIVNTVQGLIQIDGVTTQHYTEPMLTSIIKESGLRLMTLDKIEYNWETEFNRPPSWMREPYPWDWLVECTKP